MLICAGYGPHVFAWGVQFALATMGVACMPGGGMTAEARAMLIDRFKPTVLTCTPSYALHLGRVMAERGMDPAKSSIRTVLVGGEPAAGIEGTRERLEALWDARLVEFYGCTEASPHCGGYSCPASDRGAGPVTTHLMEDVQVWELVDPDDKQRVAEGVRGLTVCTNLNSESSPQLRFLVGDYTTFTTAAMRVRAHARARGRRVRRPRRRADQPARRQDVSGAARGSRTRGLQCGCCAGQSARPQCYPMPPVFISMGLDPIVVSPQRGVGGRCRSGVVGRGCGPSWRVRGGWDRARHLAWRYVWRGMDGRGRAKPIARRVQSLRPGRPSQQI